MTSNKNLSRTSIPASLLLLPLLAGLAPAASAEVSFFDRPKIEIKAGPAVTEGEPMTFTLRVTPVQAVDLVVPVLIEDGRGFINYTIPAGTRELPASVPTVDNAVDENDRRIGVTPYTGRTQPLRTRAGFSGNGWRPYIWIVVKDNDSGDRPILSLTSEAPEIPDYWNHTWVDEGDTVDFTIKAEDQVPTESFQVCLHMRDSHYGNGNFLASKDEGTKCVVFPAGQSSTTFSLPTLDDNVPAREGYDDIVVTLLPDSRLSDPSYYTKQTETLRYVRVYDNDQSSCPATPADLVQEVRRYYEANRNRADRNYGENWLRVLIAFGAETHATLQPYTVAEARASEAIWRSGWRPVRAELERLEACGSALSGTPGQQNEPVPQTPEVNITAASGGTEGGDATFTLTATPAPAADLSVSVTVTAAGDYGVATGDRTVTIPATGSATLTVATVDDSADEPNGSVTLALNAGDGYAVGALSSLAVDILDDDDPVAPALLDSVVPPLACTATSAELVKKVRGYYELNRGRAERNHGENWLRVLIAFGEETHATLQPYTSAEARVGEQAWDGWREVREELERLEACIPAVGQRSELVPQTPEISISGGSPVTEGADATFTLTATPAPASDIQVSVTVSETGSFAASGETGTRTVTVGAGGTADFTVATDDDAVDEADGSIDAAVTSGDGYTVGSSASASVSVSDNDVVPVASFDSTSSGAAEDGGTHNVRVNFSPAPAASLTLEYTLGDTKSAATRNADFTVADTVAVAKNATYVDIPVTMIDDDAYEPLETVKLILTDTDHYDLGLVSSHTLFIDDDEVDLVTRIRSWTRESSCNSECANRWKRALKALGPVKVDLINLTPMTSSEAEEIAKQDTAQSSRWTEVIAALKKREALAPTSAFVPNAELVANIREWLNETQHGQLHSYRWVRVLIALGEEMGDDEPMTVTEAQSYVDKGWDRWVAVVAELNRKAACDAGDTSQCSGVPVGQQAEEPVPQTPEVNITAVSGGTEGGDATFTLTATPAPASSLAVSVTVTATGDYGVTTGDRTVTIPATGSATLTVATVDDSTDEPNGSVTLALNAGDGYAVGALSSVAADILDDDDPVAPALASMAISDEDEAVLPPLTVSVDDAEADEGAAMEFAMRLSAPSPGKAHVFWQTRETSPASATEGVDYKGARLSVAVFRKGETEKKISISTLRDVHDDDGETFEMVIHLAVAGYGETFEVAVADGVATGTITNDGALPGAYLARFGRAVAEQALDGIAGRIDAARAPGMQGSFAGYALGFGAAPDRVVGADAGSAVVRGAPLAMSGMARGFDARAPRSGGFGTGPGGPAGQPAAARSGALGLRDALAGSSFALTGGSDASGGSVAFWGRASHSRFDGREDSLSLDGEVSTGLLGADYARGAWLAGLALARSVSEGAYRDAGIAPQPDGLSAGAGGVAATLTAAIPYASARLSERLRIWGATGLGGGEVRLKTGAGEDISAGTRWRMAAAGLRGELLSGGGAGLSLVSDALWTATDSESVPGLAASEGAASRVRAGLEGRYRFDLGRAFGGGALSGASLMPSLEVAARHDGGDAETGFGVDVGGGLALSAPSLGLAMEVRARALVAHADGAARRSGFSASLAWDPRPVSALGWSLSLRQDVGGPSGGGIDALFSGGPFAATGIRSADAPGLDASRWTAEAGYGLSAFGGRFVGTPRLGYGSSPFGRDYSVGWRLMPMADAVNAPDLSFGLTATRREGDTTGAEHGIGLDIALRW